MTESHSPPADTAMQWGAIDPFDTTDPYLWVRLEHLGRYLFALDYLREKGASHVLDAGAGTGYGCRLLAAGGLHVTFLDVDSSQITQWASPCSSLTVRAVIADLERGIDDNATYDAAVMFEVLEHLRDPRTALNSVIDRLHPGGTFLCSVPSRVWESQTTTGLPTNHEHRILFGRQEIIDLLEDCGLSVSHILGQGLCNYLMKREQKLINSKAVKDPLWRVPGFNKPDRIRDLARLFGYPTPDYAEWSYSFIVLSTKL